jgi:hypothetical protein
MKSPAIYKVNDKALNNGKQAIYSKSITTLNTELQKVTLNNILENAGKAQGCKVYVQHNGNTIDTSNRPEGIIHIIGDDVFVEAENYNYHLNPKFDYSVISDTKKIAEIEKSVTNTTYVTSCNTIAKGEWTVVFAKPNQGKTLTILATITQQIANGAINGEDVFYFKLVDAKPSYLEKLKILKRFDVIVSDEDPVAIMLHLMENRQAKDKIVIIDTPMRVCDTYNRQKVMLFSRVFKIFCELGGTVITLAHAKKYVERNRVPILEGVELIQDNAHCVYYLQKSDDIIKMINIKMRAKVKDEVTFQVGIDLPYPDLFNSVHTLTDKQAAELFNEIKQDQFAIDHESIELETIVETIKETILNGINQKTALVEAVYRRTGDYRRTVYSVLDEYEGKLWNMTRGPKKSKVYSII